MNAILGQATSTTGNVSYIIRMIREARRRRMRLDAMRRLTDKTLNDIGVCRGELF